MIIQGGHSSAIKEFIQNTDNTRIFRLNCDVVLSGILKQQTGSAVVFIALNTSWAPTAPVAAGLPVASSNLGLACVLN